jgi:KDO2-lipid IV(A) lauroyltransferase
MNEGIQRRTPEPGSETSGLSRAIERGSFQSKLQYVWEYGMHRVLSLLPIDLGGDIGSAIVRFNVRHNRPQIITGARRNLLRLRPNSANQEIDATIYSFLDNIGRLMAEFSTLDRLIPAGRVTIEGDDVVRLVNRTPIVAIILHTGNWEVLSAAIANWGVQVSSFYAPPETLAQRQIAESVRRCLGVRLLEPGSRGVREAVRTLSADGVVAIFGDEARGGHIKAPLFGRAPHQDGNLAIAARLIRKTNAAIVIAHCVRTQRSNFHLTFQGPVAMSLAPGAKPDVLADVAYLNGLIEPIVRAHLDQWYFLDDAF